MVSWYTAAIAMTVRSGWLTLPGPWYVKAVLGLVIVAILGACLMIPGPQDELVVMMLLSAMKKALDRKRVTP